MRCLKLTIIFICCLSTQLFAKLPERIIALSPHSVEILYALGAGEKIVATIEHADYPVEAKNIQRVGNFNGVQIEQIVALKPDLIIAWKNGNKKTDLDKLESLGLNIFYSHPNKIKDVISEILELGKITGLEANAQKLTQEMQDRYISIKAKYKSLKTVKVFYQLWHDPLRTIGPDNWNQSLISDCNGSNVFDDTNAPYPVVSIENVLLKDPETIIIPGHSATELGKTNIWSKWETMRAVKNNQIHQINGDLLHRYSPRAIDGLEQLCQAIDKARIVG